MSTKDKISLDFWKVVDKCHLPIKPIKCPFCGSTMIMRWSYVHQVKDNHVSKEKEAHVDDMRFKCKTCSYAPMFGVRVPKGEALQMISARNGSPLYVPIDLWMEDDELKKRLESVGYI